MDTDGHGCGDGLFLKTAQPHSAMARTAFAVKSLSFPAIHPCWSVSIRGCTAWFRLSCGPPPGVPVLSNCRACRRSSIVNCADVAGVTLAEPAIRQHVHPLHLHARILLRQSPQDFARPVGGAVVHDDDFQLDAALREQLANRLLNPRILIPRRDDHGAANRFLVR